MDIDILIHSAVVGNSFFQCLWVAHMRMFFFMFFPKEQGSEIKSREVHKMAVHISWIYNLNIYTVCSNHSQQAVNNLNYNASLSVGSTTVYNKTLVLMQAIGWLQLVSERQEGKLFSNTSLLLLDRAQRGDLQRRVAAPQSPSVYAVSELCIGLESLFSPRTCTQHEAETKQASICSHSCTLWDQITFTSKRKSCRGLTELENHATVVQKGNLR